MLLSTYLNILGACLGFISAMFFAIGALGMHPQNILKISTSYWDANQHWADSIADQRADYIVGALLLILSFSSQLAANLVPSDAAPSFLQPLGYAIAEIIAVVSFLLICSVLLRAAVAKTTRQKVQQLQKEKLAAEDLVAKNRAV
ncbi:MAG: hypothetical protein WCR74_15275 [Betaproteobacteria bacterium]